MLTTPAVAGRGPPPGAADRDGPLPAARPPGLAPRPPHPPMADRNKALARSDAMMSIMCRIPSRGSDSFCPRAGSHGPRRCPPRRLAVRVPTMRPAAGRREQRPGSRADAVGVRRWSLGQGSGCRPPDARAGRRPVPDRRPGRRPSPADEQDATETRHSRGSITPGGAITAGGGHAPHREVTAGTGCPRRGGTRARGGRRGPRARRGTRPRRRPRRLRPGPRRAAASSR